jgi:hypothetical protein
MPLRLVSGLGSIEEAEAFQWAADHGADVISVGLGSSRPRLVGPSDPQHGASTRCRTRRDGDRRRGGHRTRRRMRHLLGGRQRQRERGQRRLRQLRAGHRRRRLQRLERPQRVQRHGRRRLLHVRVEPWPRVVHAGISTTDRSGHEGYNPGDTTPGDAAGNYTNSFGGTSSACLGVAGVPPLMLAVNGDLTREALRDLLRDSFDRIDAPKATMTRPATACMAMAA